VNVVANFFQDSSRARNVLHQHQKELYGRIKAMAVNAPTRFATTSFVMRDVADSASALKLCSSNPKWSGMGGKSEQVCHVLKRALEGQFKFDLSFTSRCSL
jgi:hypothetical protein